MADGHDENPLDTAFRAGAEHERVYRTRENQRALQAGLGFVVLAAGAVALVPHAWRTGLAPGALVVGALALVWLRREIRRSRRWPGG
jgi:hypothetical protein